jgi:peroxiredoxin Q/BCP
MKLRTLSALTSFLAMSLFASAQPLTVGANAPVVAGVTETGAKIALADVYAQQTYTLVYFYPKADTPGCTAQGCSLRDAFADLSAKGVTVIGVSTDKPEAQKAFKEKYNLPFTLIADHDKQVVEAFGVPTTMGFAKRQAFLIKGGKIVWADYSAATKQQADDVLKVIAAQQG